MSVQSTTATLNSVPADPSAETAGRGSPPVSVSGGGSVGGDRPSNLLAALRSDAVVSALDVNALRCVTTDLRTFARMSDGSKSRRHRWRREEVEQRLANLPCNPSQLRPIVERVLPARIRVGKAEPEKISKRWSTIKSSIRRVLLLTGWIEDHTLLARECTPEWSRLCDAIPAPGRQAEFRRFAGLCSRRGIGPGDDVEAALEMWRQWSETSTLLLNVGPMVNVIRGIWNLQHLSNRDGPQKKLNAPRNPGHYPNADQIRPE
jgi:hypothetical protein